MIKLQDIVAAQKVIAGNLHRTPLIGSTYFGNIVESRLLFKLELYQKTGSFKPRGVLNKMHNLTPQEKKRGVISLSAGNHAQALAYVAALYGVHSTLVMPESAVKSKVDATKGYGGEVFLTNKDLLSTTLAIQKERVLTFVHPFDDPMVIAGAGTVGMEILDDAPDVDVVIVGIGGGGLASGVGAAIKSRKPNVKVVGVEPEGAAGISKSLSAGKPVHLDSVQSVADGLAAPFAGVHTLAYVQKYVDEVVLVTDEEIVEAMRLIIERCKVIAEPAAASTLAALLFGKIKVRPGSTVVCVLSGGNISHERLKSLL